MAHKRKVIKTIATIPSLTIFKLVNTTPEVKFSKKNKVGIFFGDSMCFGEGLNDNETIPYYFEKSNIDYRSINYGFMGHGPSHMLYTINTPKFKKEFKD